MKDTPQDTAPTDSNGHGHWELLDPDERKRAREDGGW
jgi:hypothetical protein